MASLKQLDLGCGGSNRIWDGYEGYGIDITEQTKKPWLKEIKAADLAFEPIPYPDGTFDLVTAYDFLEHIPPVLYLYSNRAGNTGNHKRNCMIELFNEIYRVLKDGGRLYHQTPGYFPDTNIEAVWSDPTHVYVWTPQTANQLSGDYFGMHDLYGHRTKFRLENTKYENGHFHQTFQAIKPMKEPYEAN